MCDSNKDKSIYLPELAPITKVAMMNETEMYMHLDYDIGHKPGQFVEVSIAGIGEAPISISSSPTQPGFDMVIRKAGRVTNIMHQVQELAWLTSNDPTKASPLSLSRLKNYIGTRISEYEEWNGEWY